MSPIETTYAIRIKDKKIVELLDGGHVPYDDDLVPVSEAEYKLLLDVHGDIDKAISLLFGLKSLVNHWEGRKK